MPSTHPGRVSAASQRSQDVGRDSIELEILEHREELLLFVAKVILHQGCDTLEVSIQLVRCFGSVDGVTESVQKVGDHRVVLLEREQHRREVRVSGLDRGKQGAVLALVVPVERGTEPMAVQQQVPTGLFARLAGAHRLAGEVQGCS